VIERAIIVAGKGEIQLQHLPGAFMPRRRNLSCRQNPQDEDVLTIRAGAQMREVEEAYIRLVLRHTNNNKRRRRRCWAFACERSTASCARSKAGNASRRCRRRRRQLEGAI
jgi:DNA-binding NtrC family response regulator